MMTILMMTINPTTMINLPIRRYVIIGSYPLMYRQAKDIDVVCYKKDVETEWLENDKFSGHFDFEGRRIEVLLADDQVSFQHLLTKGEDKRLATVEELFALKRAHVMRGGRNFDKHIADVAILRKTIKFIDEDLIKLHKEATDFRLGKQRTPKLNGVTKEQFFDDNVIAYYPHDDLHVLFSHTGRAMYEKMQKGDGTVTCYKELWNEFTHDEKIKTVLEEGMVISAERELIPTLKGAKIGRSPAKAFQWALMRIATNLTSGYFRDFTVDNYFEILNSYDVNYYKKLELLK